MVQWKAEVVKYSLHSSIFYGGAWTARHKCPEPDEMSRLDTVIGPKQRFNCGVLAADHYTDPYI